MTTHDVRKTAGSYVRLMAAYGRALEEVEEQERQLELEQEALDRKMSRLEKRREQVAHLFPNWKECLVTPLAKAVQRELPQYHVDAVGPVGLANTIFLVLQGKTLREDMASVAIRPGNLEIGELVIVDTESIEHEYPEGSIGEMSGFQYAVKPLESVEQVVKLLKAGLDELCSALERQAQERAE